MLRDMGGNKCRLVAHIVGGSQSLIPGSIVGDENVKIAKEILSSHHIPVKIVDVGGKHFRKIVFNNITGELIIQKGG
jgi:chemotaxis protein CheD